MGSVPYQEAGGPLRQSLLRTFDACPQAAKWDAEAPDFTTEAQALGLAVHLVAEEMLRTLGRTGHEQIPEQELIEIAYEQIAKPECPHLSTAQMSDLRIICIQLSRYEWTANRLISVEDRLFADVPCPDGKTRTITGTPDVLMAAPNHTAECIDYKSGFAAPPAPRNQNDPEAWKKDSGRPYLSERGVFQLDCLGFLILKRYPSVQRVMLREFHVRIDEQREAILNREDMEHVERRLGVLAQRLDMMLAGELEPEARPGYHCRRRCPRPLDCPIPPDLRGEGSIVSDEMAKEYAERWAVLEGQRDRVRGALQAWLDSDDSGGPIILPESYLGWKPTKSGGRSFGLHRGDPPQNGAS